MSTVVATLGTIPGAGTTSVVAALGAALGEQRLPVAVVDATADGSRVGDVLALEGGGEVADALRRSASLGEVQAAGPHGLVVFPASPDTNWGAVRPDAVGTVYEQLRERFEFVLVDCGTELTPVTAAWLGHADEALIVTDPDVAGTVDETAALATAFDVAVRGVLGTRVPPTETRSSLEDLAASGHPVLAVLPEDPTVGTAADAGESVLAHEPDSRIANCVWRLALRFRERDHARTVVTRGTVGSGGTALTAASGDDGTEAKAEADPEAEANAGADDATERAGDADSPAGTAAAGFRSGGSDATGGATDRSDGASIVGEATDPSESLRRGSDPDHARGGSEDATAASGAARDRSTEASDGPVRELSDEKIEEVFKETMQRVKRERESEEE